MIILKNGAQKLFSVMGRTKQLDSEDSMKTPLKRCLTTLDLTLLGIGKFIPMFDRFTGPFNLILQVMYYLN